MRWRSSGDGCSCGVMQVKLDRASLRRWLLPEEGVGDLPYANELHDTRFGWCDRAHGEVRPEFISLIWVQFSQFELIQANGPYPEHPVRAHAPDAEGGRAVPCAHAAAEGEGAIGWCAACCASAMIEDQILPLSGRTDDQEEQRDENSTHRASRAQFVLIG